jgi:hypothetical protein
MHRDRANIALKEIEAAGGESDRGDKLRQMTASIRRTFKLLSKPMAPVEDYDTFKDRLRALRNVERLGNQGELDG